VGEAVSIGGRVDASGGSSADEHADAQAASRTDTISNTNVGRRIFKNPLWSKRPVRLDQAYRGSHTV
jgi:hypothetical protein